MSTLLIMIISILVGSAISLLGGAIIFLTKQKRSRAINFALPLGAGALLAAAFFDLLPESFELGEPSTLLLWTLAGFTLFFILERSASWFHHHHSHPNAERHRQNMLVVTGDLVHNIIDGTAIGTAFLVSPVTGIITTLAVSVHEIPKELGTFGILLSRGWKDKKVILANILTSIGTLTAGILVYTLGQTYNLPIAELLAVTAGMFIYISASDIIPDIHNQPKRLGTIQAVILVLSIVVVGTIIKLMGV